MVFVEPIDDGIFKAEGVTIRCTCGHLMTIPAGQEHKLITCSNCGKKI